MMDLKDLKESEYYKKSMKAAEAVGQNAKKAEKVLEKSIDKLSNNSSTFRKIRLDVELLIEMVKKYFRNEYCDISNKNIVLILGGLLYLINPFDLITDMIPLAGYLDDLALLAWLKKYLDEELDKYKSWKNQQTAIVPH